MCRVRVWVSGADIKSLVAWVNRIVIEISHLNMVTYMIAYGIGRHMRTRLPFNFKPTAHKAGTTARLLAGWEALESTLRHVGTACQTRPHIDVDGPPTYAQSIVSVESPSFCASEPTS